MAEYNQDRFELDVIAKEVEAPGREALAKVYVSIIRGNRIPMVLYGLCSCLDMDF